MNDWRQLEIYFNQALELPASERVAFVTKQCGEQVALKKQMLALLKAQTQADDYLYSL